MRELNKNQLLALLNKLATKLEEKNENAKLFIVGGAAMALLYEQLRSTCDIDAVFEPSEAVRNIVAQVSFEEGLRRDWLNDGVKGFMPGVDKDQKIILEHKNLVVYVASPKYLLAMKLFSARAERDHEDVVRLLELCNISTYEQACDVLESYYPQSLLLPKHKYFVAEILELERQRKLGEDFSY